VTGSGRRRAGRVLRVVFGVAAVAFLVFAFVETWDRRPDTLTLAWWRAAAAFGLAVGGLYCGFRGWAALLGSAEARSLASGFYISQLGKYVPGGVWQVAGQIGYAVRARVTVRQATAAFVVFMVVQVAAGGMVGSATAFLEPDLPLLVRVGAGLGATSVLLLHRRWMRGALTLASRLRRSPGDADPSTLLPDQRRILVSWGWACGTMLLAGGSLAVLLDGLQPGSVTVAVIPAFGLAWAVGFLALPVPSGIGVREAVLILLLPGVAVPAIIAGAIYHRLATMAAEGGMVAVAKLRDRPVLADR
jgi:glycosyltransferase 2 family protein